MSKPVIEIDFDYGFDDKCDLANKYIFGARVPFWCALIMAVILF